MEGGLGGDVHLEFDIFGVDSVPSGINIPLVYALDTLALGCYPLCPASAYWRHFYYLNDTYRAALQRMTAD